MHLMHCTHARSRATTVTSLTATCFLYRRLICAVLCRSHVYRVKDRFEYVGVLRRCVSDLLVCREHWCERGGRLVIARVTDYPRPALLETSHQFRNVYTRTRTVGNVYFSRPDLRTVDPISD